MRAARENGDGVTEQEFGRYRLVSLLGRGGMGEVWRAVDTDKDREVALKVLGSWLGGDPLFAERFRRESALAARLNSPNIIPIHDYGEIDGRLYIDMPLIDGVDLGGVLARGPLPADRAVEIVAQVARALAVAQRAGLVHRDIKPSNILVSTTDDGDDHAYLIDFGIAKALGGARLSLPGVSLGTPAYMAPECFAGEGDHCSDVYALTCVLYECLTGRPPFTAAHALAYMNAHHHTPPPRPSETNPGVPRGLDRVVATGLAKRPEDRYRAVTALSVAARAAVRSSAAVPTVRTRPAAEVTRPATPPGPVDRPRTPAPRTTPAPEPRRPPSGPAVVAPRRTPDPAERLVLLHTSAVRGIATMTINDRLMAVTGSTDGTVRTWDLTTGVPVGEPLTAPGRIRAITARRLLWRPVVIIGCEDGSVHVRDLTRPTTGRALLGHTGAVGTVGTTQLAGVPVAVTGSVDDTVRVWDLGTGTARGRPLTGHAGAVHALAVARLGTGPVAVAGGPDHLIRGWDLASGTAFEPLHGHSGAVHAIAATERAGGPVAVSAGADRTVRVWDLTTGAGTGGAPTGHAGAIRGVAVRELGGRLVAVTASDDGTARVSDPVTGTALGRPLTGHRDGLRAVAIDELDHRPIVLTGGEDNTVRVWDLLTAMGR